MKSWRTEGSLRDGFLLQFKYFETWFVKHEWVEEYTNLIHER